MAEIGHFCQAQTESRRVYPNGNKPSQDGPVREEITDAKSRLTGSGIPPNRSAHPCSGLPRRPRGDAATRIAALFRPEPLHRRIVDGTSAVL
jgi:hypothetical protein